jgi:hypothetical protein
VHVSGTAVWERPKGKLWSKGIFMPRFAAVPSMGYFVQPTFVVTTDPKHVLMEEEIFGPVVTAYVYEVRPVCRGGDDTAERGKTHTHGQPWWTRMPTGRRAWTW